MWSVHIGGFLRAERQSREFSLERLAVVSGVGPAALSQIERGHRSPTWVTVERLLSAMGREAVLDTALPADSVASARLQALSADERMSSEMPHAWVMLQRLQRDGARLALDGPSAALLIGTPQPLDRIIHVAAPAADASFLCVSLRSGGSQGWSDRFRDYRTCDVEGRLASEPVTRWMTAFGAVIIRLVDDWRPVTVVTDEHTYACLPAGVPTATLTGAHGGDDNSTPVTHDEEWL